MLFISRYLSAYVVEDVENQWRYMQSKGVERFSTAKFGVVDTLDYKEQAVTLGELLYALSFGIQIRGVELDGAIVRGIVPYQIPDKATPLQTKLMMLRHVSVAVYDGKITGITWDNAKITKPVRVRLSDFASECDGMIFAGQASRGVVPTDVKLIVEIDDKISLNHLTLSVYAGVFGSGQNEAEGVIFDLYDLDSEEKAWLVYTCAASGLAGMRAINDRKERYERMLKKLREEGYRV